MGAAFTLAHIFRGLDREERIQTIKVADDVPRDEQIVVRFGKGENFHLFYGAYSLTLFNAQVKSMTQQDAEIVGFRSKRVDFKEWEPITVVLTRPGLGWDYDEQPEEVTVR